MQQGIGDGVDLFDPTPGERPQQWRHVGVLAHAYWDEDLALLDVRVGQVADLRLDPAALARVGREHDQPGARLLESVVDLGDDVIAGPDHPLVEPGLNPAFAQRARQRLDGRLVLRRMADENGHVGLSGCRDLRNQG